MKSIATAVVALVLLALGTALAQVDRVTVVAHTPRQDEAGVGLKEPVRVRFSADLDASTLEGHITLAYSAEDSKERGEPEPPAIAFEMDYTSADRTLVIRPIDGWLRFREVRVTLGEEIRSTSRVPLRKFQLRFTTGG